MIKSNFSEIENINKKYTKGTTGNKDRIDLDAALTSVFYAPQDKQAKKIAHLLADTYEVCIPFSDMLILNRITTELKPLNLKSWKFSIQDNYINFTWKAKALNSVSLISPIFNNNLSDLKEFISSCLTSLSSALAQKKELILIDDASSNSTAIEKIIENSRDEFTKAQITLKYFRLLENCGPAIARNFGIEKSNGENILFADSDDIIHPLYVQMLAQELDAGADFVTCDMIFPDEHIFCPEALDFSKLLKLNSNGSCIGLRRSHPKIKKLIESGHVYSNSMVHHFEDWELNIVLRGLNLNLTILPIALYFYRMQNSGRDSSNEHLKKASYYSCLSSAWSRLMAQEAFFSSNQIVSDLFLRIDEDFAKKLTATKHSPMRYRLHMGLVTLRYFELTVFAGKFPAWWKIIRSYIKKIIDLFYEFVREDA